MASKASCFREIIQSSFQRGFRLSLSLLLQEGKLGIGHWNNVCDLLIQAVNKVGSNLSECVLVGFNFGGSIAAYFAMKHSVAGLIAAGSIPRLSEFWTKSVHDIAVAARLDSSSIDKQFSQLTRQLDLTESISKLKIPLLLKFGTSDDWLDPHQIDEINVQRSINITVACYLDDHEMLSTVSAADRFAFIRRLKES